MDWCGSSYRNRHGDAILVENSANDDGLQNMECY